MRRAVEEADLRRQFPAGRVERGGTTEQAAVRETLEKDGLTVQALQLLGERVDPKTGRLMSSTSCSVDSGEAHVADEEECAEDVWVAHGRVGRRLCDECRARAFSDRLLRPGRM
ncbi:NUDIX hydrolase [Streptomyces sp. GS7]|uniref:NUDIX hydrolase n=1 Tax=Streptomyces sp. GS7 TaxID=2692234 RepID=UPI002E2AFF53|nr:NUDIX hydrolase [Streptomyces sp. GS7]